MVNLLSPRLIARWCQMEYGFKNLNREEMVKRVITRAEEIINKKFNEQFEIYHSTLDYPKLKQSQFCALTIYFPKKQQAIIIYRGSETINDWYYNYTGISAGANIDKITEALDYYYFIRKTLPKDTLYIGAGHSLGGHLISNVQLLTAGFIRVYTFNTAIVQLYQLQQIDAQFNKKLQSYYYDNPRVRGTIENFAKYYYQKNANVIINFKRKNDFIHFFYDTPGAFIPGITMDLPPLLSKIVNPHDYMSESDIQILLSTLSELYHYLLSKDITTSNIHQSTHKLIKYSQYFLFNKLIKPLQVKHWLPHKTQWIRIGGIPYQSTLQPSTIDEAYQTFKAIYHYITFLVHTGLITETMLDKILQQEIKTKFKYSASLNQLLVPLLRFINVLKAMYSYIEYKQGKEINLTGWKYLAKLHYLDYLYDVLPLEELD